MKMKMTILAGALALATAGQAFALGTPSDLFLTVVDSNTTAGTFTVYSRDLGVNMASFQSLVTSGTTAASAGNSSFAADTNLTSFLSGVGAGDSLSWSVSAAQTGAMSLTGPEAFMVTTDVTTLPSSQQNGTLAPAIQAFNTYYVDSLSYQSNGLTSGSTTGATDISANGNLKFGYTAGLGTGMDMFYVTPSSNSSLKTASAAIFGGATTADVWTLSSTGNLTVTAASVAAVPEASEWLLMLSGFGLIGFIASRRKHSGGALTFA